MDRTELRTCRGRLLSFLNYIVVASRLKDGQGTLEFYYDLYSYRQGHGNGRLMKWKQDELEGMRVPYLDVLFISIFYDTDALRDDFGKILYFDIYLFI